MANRLISQIGRAGLGLAVVGGLALIAGLDSTIEAKPPTDPAGMLRDLEKLSTRPLSGLGRMASSSEAPRSALVGTTAVERSVPVPIVRTMGSTSGIRFELTGAAKLSIKFHGQQDLTGDYRVNPDETVSVPALGRLSITGLSAAEFESVLVDRAAKVTGRESYITVEVAEYRPVFVSGLVSRPGSHAWQPGMTVLHAVTLLGGIYRATSETSGGASIGADGEILRLRKAINDLKRSTAALARLRAERANSNTIEVPQALADLVGKAEADALIGEQTSVLANRRAGLSAQIEAIERAKAIAEQELAGLVAQSMRLREILEQRRIFTGKLEGMQAKGMVRVDRAIEEQTRLSELEDRATTVSVGIARVQSTMAQLERDVIALQQQRIAETDQEIFKINKESAQLELEIDSARSAYFKITGTPAPLTFGGKDAQRTAIIEYQVVRYEGGVQTSLRVDQFTRVKPGDIIIVDVQKD